MNFHWIIDIHRIMELIHTMWSVYVGRGVMLKFSLPSSISSMKILRFFVKYERVLFFVCSKLKGQGWGVFLGYSTGGYRRGKGVNKIKKVSRSIGILWTILPNMMFAWRVPIKITFIYIVMFLFSSGSLRKSARCTAGSDALPWSFLESHNTNRRNMNVAKSTTLHTPIPRWERDKHTLVIAS